MWAVRGPTRLASRLDFGRLSLLAPAHGGSKPPARRPVDATTIGRAAATAAQPSDAADAPVVPHVSVMLNEVLEAFRPVKVNVYVDGTLGAGGHAVAVLAAHRELHTLVGIDLDPTAREIASRRLQAAARPGVNVHLVAGNYRRVGLGRAVDGRWGGQRTIDENAAPPFRVAPAATPVASHKPKN